MRVTISSGLSHLNENRRAHLTPESDPVMWNVNNALSAVLTALEDQERRISAIEQDLRRTR